MKKNKQILLLFTNPKNIRFWILIFFLFRLYGITNPPLEDAHNWRQTTVTMVSRNFIETDANILYPRIDIAGEKTGITGMEFPFFNYLIYLMSVVFGYQHWYGRLINLIVSSIGIYFFFLLIKKYFSERTSFFSSLILLVSIWFPYSRKIMPDTFAMSFVIVGLYYGLNYIETNFRKIHLLILYFTFTTLGILSKLPTGYLLVLFIPILILNQKNKNGILLFTLISLISIILIGIWYFKWVPYLVEKYNFWHFFMGKSASAGALEIIKNLNLTASRFYETALKYIGFTIFLYGLFIAFKKNDLKIIIIFFLAFFSFSIIILKAGFTFAHHSYYIIPFVPVMALIAGYALSQIRVKWIATFLLIVIGLEGILNQLHDFRIKEKEAAILNLEADLNKFSIQNDLILINSGDYPTPMYFAHRKGWVASNDKILKKDYINELKNKGLKHIIILKRTFGSSIELPYKKVFDNNNYSIYTP